MAAADDGRRGPPPALEALQRRLFALITAPQGVAAGLEGLGMTRAELGALVGGDGRADAVARLDVYANMYFFRILDVLRAHFPKLAAVVGETAFHDLATDYVAAHPSTKPSLRETGRDLPAFVANHAAALARPWLAELAALEWARVDVFDRRDAPVLSRARLVGLPPEAFAALPLALCPAHEIVPTRHAVEEIWRAIEHGGEGAAADAPPPPPADADHALLVWRRGVTVHHRPLAPGEGEALALARAGTTFGELCAALGQGRDEAEAARLAAELLGSWIDEELLQG